MDVDEYIDGFLIPRRLGVALDSSPGCVTEVGSSRLNEGGADEFTGPDERCGCGCGWRVRAQPWKGFVSVARYFSAGAGAGS